MKILRSEGFLKRCPPEISSMKMQREYGIEDNSRLNMENKKKRVKNTEVWFWVVWEMFEPGCSFGKV